MNDTLETEIVDKNEFEYLLKLLDDEDEKIYTSIKERFLSYGEPSVNFLKKYLKDENEIIKERAGEIISILRFDETENRFKKLVLNEKENLLEEGIFLIASFGYPEINMNDYKGKLDKMAQDIEARLTMINTDIRAIPPLDVLNTINNYLFVEKLFKGNTEKFFETDNSYINRVIDTKNGIPISLSIIYILLAKRIGIPIHGINLPGHFIIKYSDERDEFFIDPFNKGVTISKNDAAEFIKKIGMESDKLENIPYLKKTSDTEILLRVMRNLLELFKEKKEILKHEQMEKLMLCLS